MGANVGKLNEVRETMGEIVKGYRKNERFITPMSRGELKAQGKKPEQNN